MSRIFFESFWETEQKNVLFVSMPFHRNLDNKFRVLDEIAKGAGFERAERVDRIPATEFIPSKVLDSIANSKFLLFDLSDDPKYDAKQVNGNVLYELGVATAIREPTDIVVIRDEKSESDIPFNIRQLPRHTLNANLDGLGQILKSCLENQDWSRSKRVKAIAERLDMQPFMLKNIVDKHYRNRPEGEPDHFHHIPASDPLTQLSINRLLDFGILRLGTGKGARELSYNWTPFGRVVLKYLGIKKESKNS